MCVSFTCCLSGLIIYGRDEFHDFLGSTSSQSYFFAWQIALQRQTTPPYVKESTALSDSGSWFVDSGFRFPNRVKAGFWIPEKYGFWKLVRGFRIPYLSRFESLNFDGFRILDSFTHGETTHSCVRGNGCFRFGLGRLNSFTHSKRDFGQLAPRGTSI